MFKICLEQLDAVNLTVETMFLELALLIYWQQNYQTSYFSETGVLSCSNFFIITFLHQRFLTLSGIPSMQ